MKRTKKRRANVAANARQSVRVQADFEHYTLVAGIIIAVSFGLMFLLGW